MFLLNMDSLVSSQQLEAFIVSLKTASVSILLTFFLGILAAYFVLKINDKRLKTLWDILFTLPLVLPPTVLGFFLLYLLGVNRPIGKFFIDVFSFQITFSWIATVIAAVVVSFPLMYRSARGAFEQVDPNMIYAAKTLGLSEWKIFWKIIFPLALPGIVSGGILAFARGLGEFGATSMIAGNIAEKTRTLPLAVYSAVAGGRMDEAWGYVIIIVIIAFIAIGLMNYFAYKEKRIK